MNDEIESKWCNWELGFGDANKYKGNIALFPMKGKGESDYLYKGNEYMSIHPHIVYFYGTEKYKSGAYIERGYYVREEQADGSSTITLLKKWLNGLICYEGQTEEGKAWEVRQDNLTKNTVIIKRNSKSQYKMLRSLCQGNSQIVIL